MSKPNIYITRKISEEIIAPYRKQWDIRMWEREEEPVPRDILLQEVKQVDGLLSMLSDKVDGELLDMAPDLKIVSNLAVGYDNIDVAEAQKRNVLVTNTPDVLTETTADLAFALLMATARRLVESNEYIKNNQWKNWSPYLLAGSDVHHKTIGIVGMGRIGEAVARRARGFGMKVLYHNRTRKYDAEKTLPAAYVDFDVLLNEADFVVSVIPLTPETNKMFNESVFNKMKTSAIFINVSRGAVVDEGALLEALKTKQIKAAGLDVFDGEPIQSDHPFVQLDNVICLPHIGSASKETRTNMMKLCLENITAVMNGYNPKTPVSKN
ncbi:2-hydroxyacid dehydrogenase [Virgibacillus ainsalahensis]